MSNHSDVARWLLRFWGGRLLSQFTEILSSAPNHLILESQAQYYRSNLIPFMTDALRSYFHICAAAAMSGSLELLKEVRFFTPGGPIDYFDETFCWRDSVYYGAAASGHLDILNYAYEHGLQFHSHIINIYTAPLGATPVSRAVVGLPAAFQCYHIAAENGHIAVLEWLKNHGYSPITPNYERRKGLSTVVDCAARGGQICACEWALANLLPVSENDQDGSLRYSMLQKVCEIAVGGSGGGSGSGGISNGGGAVGVHDQNLALLQWARSPPISAPWGNAIQIAVDRRSWACLEWALRHGGAADDPTVSEQHIWSCLVLAGSCSRWDIVKLIMNKGFIFEGTAYDQIMIDNLNMSHLI